MKASFSRPFHLSKQNFVKVRNVNIQEGENVPRKKLVELENVNQMGVMVALILFFPLQCFVYLHYIYVIKH